MSEKFNYEDLKRAEKIVQKLFWISEVRKQPLMRLQHVELAGAIIPDVYKDVFNKTSRMLEKNETTMRTGMEVEKEKLLDELESLVAGSKEGFVADYFTEPAVVSDEATVTPAE